MIFLLFWHSQVLEHCSEPDGESDRYHKVKKARSQTKYQTRKYSDIMETWKVSIVIFHVFESKIKWPLFTLIKTFHQTNSSNLSERPHELSAPKHRYSMRINSQTKLKMCGSPVSFGSKRLKHPLPPQPRVAWCDPGVRWWVKQLSRTSASLIQHPQTTN